MDNYIDRLFHADLSEEEMNELIDASFMDCMKNSNKNDPLSLIHITDMRRIAQKTMRKKKLTEKEARMSLGLKKYE